MKHIKISSTPNTWLEFPDSLTDEEIAQKVARYKELQNEKDQRYQESLKRLSVQMQSKKHHRSRANGHSIPECSFAIKINGKTAY